MTQTERNERREAIRDGLITVPAKLTFDNLDDAIDRGIFKSMKPQNQGRTILIMSEPDEFSVGREFYVLWADQEDQDSDFAYCEAVITDGVIEI